MDDSTDASSQQGTSRRIALSITFTGPFLFDFHHGPKNITVDVYAPFCPFHEAGFFFSRGSYSETDMWNCSQLKRTQAGKLPKDKRIYAIEGGGIHANPGKPAILGPVYPDGPSQKAMVETILTTRAVKKFAPRFDKMMFKLSVPRPQFVFPLYYDFVETVLKFSDTPKNEYVHCCTALRFFYVWNAKSAIQLKIPSGDTRDITPPVFSGFPTMADIEVRHQGLDLADENDPHSDARSCFASLATLAGVEWWLNYGDGMSCPTNPGHASAPDKIQPDPCQDNDTLGPAPRLHTGGDCHAPIIVNGLDL